MCLSFHVKEHLPAEDLQAMADFTTRSRAVLGDAAAEALTRARVVIVGLGGVGSYAAEAVVRTGVGHVVLVDHDTVDLTNCNRQLIALHSTVGMRKTDAASARMLDINPDCDVRALPVFCDASTVSDILTPRPDCVLDCIDSVRAKCDLIAACSEAGIPVFSALGTGRKLDPTRLRVCDIFETSGDPLARAVRHELRARGVQALTVVCSDEPPAGKLVENGARPSPGSIAWVPGCAGLTLASLAIRTITEEITP